MSAAEKDAFRAQEADVMLRHCPDLRREAEVSPTSIRLQDLALFAVLAVAIAVVTPAENAYDGPVRLARELVAGRTYLPSFLPWMEMYRHDGRDYLVYPPMVSFLLVPYVWITGGAFGQPPFNSLLLFGSAVLLFFLIRRLDGISHLAPVGAVAYALGTPVLYSASAGDIWRMMHSEGNFFLLCALLLAPKRWFAAGFCFMVAAQTRYVISLTGLVFGLAILREAFEARSPILALRLGSRFALGALPPLLLVLGFQWWTLGDPFLTPYSAGWHQYGLRAELFSLSHVAGNLPVYTYLYPQPLDHFPFLRFDPAGQSIFVMSPFFLGVFLLDWRRQFVPIFLPSIILMQCFYLVYFWSGYSQFGARYMQDLYPLLLPVALSAFARSGSGWGAALRVLVGLAVMINVYGVYVMSLFPQ